MLCRVNVSLKTLCIACFSFLAGCASLDPSVASAKKGVLAPLTIQKAQATTSQNSSLNAASTVANSSDTQSSPIEPIIMKKRTESPSEIKDSELSLDTNTPVLISVEN